MNIEEIRSNAPKGATYYNDEISYHRAEISDLKREVIVLNMDIGALKADKDFLENECLQLKIKLSKIEQMNWWKRIVFIFKGCK